MDQCLKVFVSGVCSHPDNEADRMHVCTRGEHKPELYHLCVCGKSWTDAQVLTHNQYLVAAYMKAVE